MRPEGIVVILIAIGILGGIMLLIREVVLWYWKINEGIRLQEESIKTQRETNDLLRDLINKTDKTN